MAILCKLQNMLDAIVEYLKICTLCSSKSLIKDPLHTRLEVVGDELLNKRMSPGIEEKVS